MCCCAFRLTAVLWGRLASQFPSALQLPPTAPRLNSARASRKFRRCRSTSASSSPRASVLLPSATCPLPSLLWDELISRAWLFFLLSPRRRSDLFSQHSSSSTVTSRPPLPDEHFSVSTQSQKLLSASPFHRESHFKMPKRIVRNPKTNTPKDSVCLPACLSACEQTETITCPVTGEIQADRQTDYIIN